jgi:hypothetical protein
MLFTFDAHPGLADGSITTTFRLWKRPQVKVGGRYRVGPVTIEVDALHLISVEDISDADARRSGAADRAAVLRRLGAVDDRPVSRIRFHRVDGGPDQRAVLAAEAHLSEADVDAVAVRLDRLDRASPHGPWTRAVLDLIGENPGVVSTELATALGRDRPSFKADVRKLKALGLTESLEIGYRLSPRGRAVRQALKYSRLDPKTKRGRSRQGP